MLNEHQNLKIDNSEVKNLVDELVAGAPLDKRFVYYLLGATGICVVPISSFCSELFGFRVTLLECDDEKMKWIYRQLHSSIKDYIAST